MPQLAGVVLISRFYNASTSTNYLEPSKGGLNLRAGWPASCSQACNRQICDNVFVCVVANC